MTISVAGLGHQSQLWQWLTKFAGAEGAAAGPATTAAGSGNASPDPTSFAQTSASLATILVQLDAADEAPTFATAASPALTAPGTPSDATGDTSDSLLAQLEGDLKALFSDLHTSGLSLRTSTLQAPDSLLSNLNSNLSSLLPSASGDSGPAVDPTGDSGDSLLAQLESDLKNLFADLQSVAGKPAGATDRGETSAASLPDPAGAAGASPALLRVLGAYTEAGTGDGTVSGA